jgi:hypothetical protein
MKWRVSNFQFGCVRACTHGRLVMLPASPSEPGPNDDEPNRGGGQSFIDQKLNHRRRQDDLGAGRYGRNSRYPNSSASDDQSVSQGRQTHGHVNRIYAFDPYSAVRCPITLTRREFVQTAVSAATAGLLGCSPTVQQAMPPEDLMYATLRSRPRKPTEKVSRGFQPLKLGADRDGFLYVPEAYSPENATPLVVLLHGAGRHSSLFGMGNIDPDHIALGGFSDGASYALSLGLAMRWFVGR